MFLLCLNELLNSFYFFNALYVDYFRGLLSNQHNFQAQDSTVFTVSSVSTDSDLQVHLLSINFINDLKYNKKKILQVKINRQ